MTLIASIITFPQKKIWKKKMLPSTLDPRHGTLPLDMEPSTLDPRQKDRLHVNMFKLKREIIIMDRRVTPT